MARDIYATELADVTISPSEASLIQAVNNAKKLGVTLPARILDKHAALLADIDRVARWKWLSRGGCFGQQPDPAAALI